jgi:hypothetical protein
MLIITSAVMPSQKLKTCGTGYGQIVSRSYKSSKEVGQESWKSSEACYWKLEKTKLLKL